MPAFDNLLEEPNELLGAHNRIVRVNDVTPQQPPPVFTPPAGEYTDPQNVTIMSDGTNTIYYTTDGSTPTTASTLYIGPVLVDVTETLKAIAVNVDVRVRTSEVMSGNYIISGSPATNFVMLGAATITNTGLTVISGGDIGLYPGVSVMGFPPGILSPPGVFHINDAMAQAEQASLAITFADIFAFPSTGPLSADISGETYTTGVWTNASSVILSAGSVTLDAQGDPDAFFLFQIGTTLTLITGTSVVLVNGAQAKNVFWGVGTSATIGTSAIVNGALIAHDSVTLNTSAQLTGAGVATLNGAITLDTNIITKAV